MPRGTAGARCIRETAAIQVVLPHGGSGAVIRVAGEDLLRAVQLLQQHRADEQVRPGHCTERQDRIGLVENGLTEPVGAANRESHGPGAVIAPGGKPAGQVAARPFLTAFIERNKARIRRPGGEEQFGLARLQLRRRQFPFLFHFDDRRRRNEPVGIVGLKIVERTSAQAADREQVTADRRSPLLQNRFDVRQIRTPHFFEIVIGADFRPEEMDDDIAGVEQHPIALALALDGEPARDRLFQVVGQG
jgi:hypothetical protein